MNRRLFLQKTALSGCIMAFPAVITMGAVEDADALIRKKVEENRPGQLKRLPENFNDRVGAAHVAGLYHLTSKPFLVEGAEKLIEMGTRLGKFWLVPDDIARSYPHNSRWPACKTLLDMVETSYYQDLFRLPYATIFLEAHTVGGGGWAKEQPAAFYDRITSELYNLTSYFYKKFHDRPITIVLQNWEGDWLMRGDNSSWNPPPATAAARCKRFLRWCEARQAGVAQARKEAAAGARCRVAHAIEVNRVFDMEKGIPTVTTHVLPHVEVDLVSYSSYDGMKNGVSLYKALEIIRRHARTGPLFGPGAVCIGEIGIPEYEQPQRVRERWEDWMGAALAANAAYIVQWELYCNEANPKLTPKPKLPITDPSQARGFWLIKPDGTPGETGKYFLELWRRAQTEALNKPGQK